MGFIDFTTGQVLTADQVDLIMRQSVMVFDTESERDTELTSVLAEGMVAYTKDTKIIRKYNGSNWADIGEDAVLTEGESGQDVVSDGSAGIRYENSISPFLLLGV